MTRRPNPEEEGVSKLPGAELYLTPKTVPGLPTRYGVASRDRDVTAFEQLFTDPVINVDRLCRLEARIGAPGAAAVLVVADGFAPKVRLPIILESQGEVVNIEVTTDHSGHVVAGFPFIGQDPGVLKAPAQEKSRERIACPRCRYRGTPLRPRQPRRRLLRLFQPTRRPLHPLQPALRLLQPTSSNSFSNLKFAV